MAGASTSIAGNSFGPFSCAEAAHESSKQNRPAAKADVSNAPDFRRNLLETDAPQLVSAVIEWSAGSERRSIRADKIRRAGYSNLAIGAPPVEVKFMQEHQPDVQQPIPPTVPRDIGIALFSRRRSRSTACKAGVSRLALGSGTRGAGLPVGEFTHSFCPPTTPTGPLALVSQHKFFFTP